MATVKITDDSFENDVLHSDKVVLVDFWAEWCGPCKMISPILEEVAHDIDSEAVIGKMNIDENPQTPAQLGVRSIPTLMLFNKGELIETRTGVQSKSSLVQWIQSV